MKRIILFLIYLIIQIIWIPIAIIGLIIGLYKEMYLSRKLDISFSAGQALQYRWIMHMFDTRTDSNTIAFTKKFPCESHFGLWAVMGPFIIMHKLFGFKSTFNSKVDFGYETLQKIAGNRVLLFDRIIEKYIDKVDQIVLPGAGFDLITNKYTKDKDIKVYELDQVNTIKMKLDTLRKANIDHDWITYITVDYNNESWSDKLLESGFDKNKKTLFLWQSVSLYLDEELVIDSLKKMKQLGAQGSIIAQDFYSKAFLDGNISKMAIKNMDMIGKLGEPWKFALDMSDGSIESINNFLELCDLELNKNYQFGVNLGLENFYNISISLI